MDPFSSGTISEEALVHWLLKKALHDGIEEKTVRSLVLYLADLGVFRRAGDSSWAPGDLFPSASGEDAVLQKLKQLCSEERGFVLVRFLSAPPENSVPCPLQEPSSDNRALSEGLINEEGKVLAKSSSNLSNLQIVKKVGRQLSPFLELEKRFLDLTVGEHTTRQDARKLFNFYLSQVRHKGTPKAWEQLSRRRHK